MTIYCNCDYFMEVANGYFNLTTLVQHLTIGLECLNIISGMIFKTSSFTILDIYWHTKASKRFKQLFALKQFPALLMWH